MLSVIISSCTYTLPTALSPLSLHDALPILLGMGAAGRPAVARARRARPRAPLGRGRRRHEPAAGAGRQLRGEDRKSTRLNSSHVAISYAVFCLKKKKKRHTQNRHKNRQKKT